MGRLQTIRIKRWEYLGPALVAVLVLSLAPSLLHAQGIDGTRLSINQFVRDLLDEKEKYSTDRVPDSSLDRMIHYAQFQAMIDLGEKTNVDTAVILGVQGQMRYYLNDNSVSGRIVGAVRRTETSQGRGDVGMVPIDLSQAGKLGEGVIPNSYDVFGNYFIVGTPPLGSDTFFVYYTPKPQDLLADDSTLAVAEEDRVAVAYLAAAWTYASNLDLNMATFWMNMYYNHLKSKGIGAPSPQEVQP